MVLEFRPPYEVNKDRDRQSLDRLGQTFSGLGDTAMQFSKQYKENKVQDAKLALLKQQSDREQGIYDYEYGGNSGGGKTIEAWSPGFFEDAFGTQPTSPKGSFPSQGNMGLQPPTQPNFSMAGGQSAYVPPESGAAPQPIDHTTHFNNWKSMGMPSTYDHPDYGGTGQGNSPLSRYSQVMSMPGAKRRGEALAMFKESDAHDLQQSEITKNNAMAGMYGNKGANGGGDVTWHLDPFTQTYVPLPKHMPAGGGSTGYAPSPQGRAPGGNTGTASGGGLDAKTQWKRNAELPKARGSATNTLQQYDTMIRDAEDILKDSGLNYATGATSFTNKIPGSPMKNVAAKLDTLKAKTLLNVLGSMKELSTNGASGFGALSEVEGENIRNSVSSLDMKQGTEAFKKNLQQFISDMKNKRSTIGTTFKSTYGEDLSGGGASPMQGGDTGNAPQMKVINGVRYEKHGDQWYEASN